MHPLATSPSQDHPTLRAWVRDAVGLSLRESDTAALQTWLDEQLQRLHLPHIKAYADLLAQNNTIGQNERALLHGRLTTGETYFYRDPAQLRVIAEQLLLPLVQLRQDQRRLRLWSAGCATGEEAYTLAMLLMELPVDWSGWDVRILGTDINPAAIETAREGHYSAWSFRALDASRRLRYFLPQGDTQWRVRPELQALVHFASMDLVQDSLPEGYPPMGAFDLIVCRNVFIYMTPETVTRVTQRLGECMADGGYLVCGHSELLGQNLHGLHTRVFPHSLAWHKTASPEPEPAPTLFTTAPPPSAQDKTGATGVARKTRLLQPQPARQPETASTQTLLDDAWAQANAGNPTKALQLCARIEQQHPLDARPLYLRAQLAQEGGQWSEALRLLDQVLYLEPDTVAAYVESASLYQQLGQHPRARQRVAAACRLLRRLPADTPIAPYESTVAGDLLAYLSAQASTSSGEAGS